MKEVVENVPIPNLKINNSKLLYTYNRNHSFKFTDFLDPFLFKTNNSGFFLNNGYPKHCLGDQEVEV